MSSADYKLLMELVGKYKMGTILIFLGLIQQDIEKTDKE